MLHRIRKAFVDIAPVFHGTMEVDKAYFGGKRANMSNVKRKELENAGRGPVTMTAVVAAKDRDSKQVVAKVIDRTDAETLQGFVDRHATEDGKLYTDDPTA